MGEEIICHRSVASEESPRLVASATAERLWYYK